MNIGIIGYGSMGKMLFEKLQAAGYTNAKTDFIRQWTEIAKKVGKQSHCSRRV